MRRWIARWGVLTLMTLALVFGAAAAADARPTQVDPVDCDELDDMGLGTEEAANCRAQATCRRGADIPEVKELCDAFADFGLAPTAVHACVDEVTLDIAPRCVVPDWRSGGIFGDFRQRGPGRDTDWACNTADESLIDGSRAKDWVDLRGHNLGFPRIYEKVCLDGPQTVADWTPGHAAAVAYMMTIEEHWSISKGEYQAVCNTWDSQNWGPNFIQIEGEAGLIKESLNHLCDAFRDLGWPAYPGREDSGNGLTVHPGCAAVRDVEDRPYSRHRGNDPGSRFGTDFVPDGCWGTYPATNYDVGFEAPEIRFNVNAEDTSQFDLAGWMWGHLTAFTFNIAKGVTTLALWTVDWGFYGFDIRDYDEASDSGVDRFGRLLVNNDDFPLIPLAWLALFGWAGYTVLRGRLTMAGTEILFSIVLFGLSGVLIANHEDYMNSTWGVMDRASTAVLAAGQGQDPVSYEPADGSEVGDPETEESRALRRELIHEVNGSIFRVFVEESYDYLNWGQSLGDPNDEDNPLRACAALRNQAVAEGPHGTGGDPRDIMRDGPEECAHLADFQARPTGERLFGAILTLTASLVVSILLLLVSLTIAVAKLLGVVGFATLPFAAPIAILPGNGRRLAWSFVTMLIQVVTVVVGLSYLLSLLLLLLEGLLASSSDVSLIERFTVLNLIVFVIWFARKRLLAASQSFASRLGDYWSSTRGTGATWTGAGPGAGIDLMSTDRTAGAIAIGGAVATAVPAALVARTTAQRWRERRVVGRNRRMLRQHANWRYGEYGTI